MLEMNYIIVKNITFISEQIKSLPLTLSCLYLVIIVHSGRRKYENVLNKRKSFKYKFNANIFAR